MSGDEGRVDPRGRREALEEADRSGPDPAPAPAARTTEGRRAEPPPHRPEDPDEITFEEIRERAYDLWERNHRPEGLEIQFWLVAERELRAERERRLSNRSGAPSDGA